jgi:hypothetical protein
MMLDLGLHGARHLRGVDLSGWRGHAPEEWYRLLLRGAALCSTHSAG